MTAVLKCSEFWPVRYIQLPVQFKVQLSILLTFQSWGAGLAALALWTTKELAFYYGYLQILISLSRNAVRKPMGGKTEGS